jgi:1-deoxy-D-xylulose-5-phosphate synthase
MLESINSPEDLKELSSDVLPQLAQEIRERIISVVRRQGGHLASNLGVVELTIALHRVFSSPRDKIIWDVGHQCYAHKILTGRNSQFDTLREKGGISGFPKRSESEHDVAETGHSATSPGIALGLLLGQELQQVEGKVIAVIGDGSLTGGMAYEAMNHAGDLQKPLILILNDNRMSISPNVGALSRGRFSRFGRISETISRITLAPWYRKFRDWVDKELLGIPLIGGWLLEAVLRWKRGVKASILNENIFTDLGFEYVGPVDGHSINRLIKTLNKARDLKRPVVIHVLTRKGQGNPEAEGNPTKYHGVSPYIEVDGKVEPKQSLSYTEAFSRSLMRLAEKDERIVALTAAMAEGTGLSPFRSSYPGRFFDVGIAEQHLLALSAGLAEAGSRPVAALYSTFFQRAVDQFIHDIAQPCLPVVVALDRAGLVGGDGETHQGAFDIPMILPVPGVTLLSPGCLEEMEMMLEYAVAQKSPVVIRYPKGECFSGTESLKAPLIRGRGAMVRQTGAAALLITDGNLLSQGLQAVSLLAGQGRSVDLLNLRFLKPLDQSYLLDLLSRYEQIFLYEDGARIGGVGSRIADLIASAFLPVRFHHYGIPDEFIPHGTRNEVLTLCGLNADGMVREMVRVGDSTKVF